MLLLLLFFGCSLSLFLSLSLFPSCFLFAFNLYVITFSVLIPYFVLSIWPNFFRVCWWWVSSILLANQMSNLMEVNARTSTSEIVEKEWNDGQQMVEGNEWRKAVYSIALYIFKSESIDCICMCICLCWWQKCLQSYECIQIYVNIIQWCFVV